MVDRPYIAVIGAAIPDAPSDAVAEDVGRALAERGAVVVCGGMTGVMAAVCRGAKSAGGTTVGILPGSDRADANEWVDVAITTGLGEVRNTLVVRAVDGVIAVGGEFGTLSEIAFALKTGVPVVGIGTWELSRPGADDDPIVRASSPEEAADTILRLTRRPE